MVFPTGLVPMDENMTDGTRILLYYGAADTVVGVAESTVGELIAAAFEGTEGKG